MKLLGSRELLGLKILPLPAVNRPRMIEPWRAGANATCRARVMGCAAASTTTRPMQIATSRDIILLLLTERSTLWRVTFTGPQAIASVWMMRRPLQGEASDFRVLFKFFWRRGR